MNKILLIGELGRDPEMRYTPDGDPVASFIVATQREWVAPDGEPCEATEWFNVVAWHNLAEVCKTDLHTGSKIYLEGRLQTRCWEAESGKQLYCTEVVAEKAIPLDAEL